MKKSQKQKIYDYIKIKNDWVSQRELQLYFIKEANPETVARRARELAEAGVIKHIKEKGYVSYKYIATFSPPDTSKSDLMAKDEVYINSAEKKQNRLFNLPRRY